MTHYHIKPNSTSMDLRLKHPCTITISGPTGSGKTELTKKIIRSLRAVMVPVPEEIIWCYTEYQPGYAELESIPNVKLIEGVPDRDMLKQSKGTSKCVVLDDMMSSKQNNKLTDLFIKGSHHWNLTVINLVQNLFYNNQRTSRINSAYLFLLKNPSDKLQISNLSRQLFPESKHLLVEAYKDATIKPYSYLLVDCHQKTPEEYRIRTGIFPEEDTTVYTPK